MRLAVGLLLLVSACGKPRPNFASTAQGDVALSSSKPSHLRWLAHSPQENEKKLAAAAANSELKSAIQNDDLSTIESMSQFATKNKLGSKKTILLARDRLAKAGKAKPVFCLGQALLAGKKSDEIASDQNTIVDFMEDVNQVTYSRIAKYAARVDLMNFSLNCHNDSAALTQLSRLHVVRYASVARKFSSSGSQPGVLRVHGIALIRPAWEQLRLFALGGEKKVIITSLKALPQNHETKTILSLLQRSSEKDAQNKLIALLQQPRREREDKEAAVSLMARFCDATSCDYAESIANYFAERGNLRLALKWIRRAKEKSSVEVVTRVAEWLLENDRPGEASQIIKKEMGATNDSRRRSKFARFHKFRLRPHVGACQGCTPHLSATDNTLTFSCRAGDYDRLSIQMGVRSCAADASEKSPFLSTRVMASWLTKDTRGFESLVNSVFTLNHDDVAVEVFTFLARQGDYEKANDILSKALSHTGFAGETKTKLWLYSSWLNRIGLPINRHVTISSNKTAWYGRLVKLWLSGQPPKQQLMDLATTKKRKLQLTLLLTMNDQLTDKQLTRFSDSIDDSLLFEKWLALKWLSRDI